MKRYASEILERLPDLVERVYPRYLRGQLLGQAWVQACLPFYTKGQLLWSPTGVGPLMKSNQVLTIHDVSPVDHPEWYTREYAAWIRAVLLILVRRVRLIISVSEFTKQRLVDLYDIDSGKVRVVYNGVSEAFSPKSKEKERRVRRKLKIPTDSYVLSLSTLAPRKNMSRLLEAWGRARHRIGDEWWLVMVGEKGAAHGTTDLDVPDQVLFTGYVEDKVLPPLYSGAAAFLYPSLYEGFGLPPLEAMASGTPPLVSDRTSLPEVVGEAGVLVHPEDADSITEGILRLIQDEGPSGQLREKGLRRARQFGWDRAARKTWTHLQEAASFQTTRPKTDG